MRTAYRRSGVRVIFRFCRAKRPSQSGTSGKNGADQIRKPPEGDGVQPHIGEAVCASFFGFAKQNVRSVRDKWEKRRRPNKKTARGRRYTAANRRSRVRVIFRFCGAKRPPQSGTDEKNDANQIKKPSRRRFFYLVRVTGLEPARWSHQNLNLARLPIPPHPHINTDSILIITDFTGNVKRMEQKMQVSKKLYWTK